MIFVVDSSVAVKWFLAEPDHALAVNLSKTAEEIYAPELLIAEVTNVAWKEAIRKNITTEQARAIAAQILCEGLLSSGYREGHIRMSIHRTVFLKAGAALFGLKM